MFVHPLSDVQTDKIGKNTQIWQFVVILPGATIGENCNICAHTFMENAVQVGHHVTIKSGVYLWDGITLEDHVFIGPNVTFTNDRYPASKCWPKAYPQTTIKQHSSIGANATILPGITVGEYSLVGAGAVVTRDVPAHVIVAGNPARIIRHKKAHD